MKSIVVLVFSLITLAAAHSYRPQALRPRVRHQRSQPMLSARGAKTDKAAAYYHYTMAHMYEEQMAVYGRSDLATKAIEEYRLAIEADPTSEYLTSGLAELYAKTGRIRDAVLEAQDILKRDPQQPGSPQVCWATFICARWGTCSRAAVRTTC